MKSHSLQVFLVKTPNKVERFIVELLEFPGGFPEYRITYPWCESGTSWEWYKEELKLTYGEKVAIMEVAPTEDTLKRTPYSNLCKGE